MHQKSLASRNAISNFFLSHMDWLILAISCRTKHSHFNFAEGGVKQEGSWRTGYNLVADLLKNPKEFKSIYNNMDDFQKKNLRRVMVDFGFANALALMALALSRYIDDEKDPLYALTVADVFMTRLATEQIGSTLGMPTALWDVTENPLMLKDKLEDWSKVNQLFDGEKRNSYLSKLIPFYREVDRFSDPTKYREKYVHFQTNDKELFYNYAFMSNFFKK